MNEIRFNMCAEMAAVFGQLPVSFCPMFRRLLSFFNIYVYYIKKKTVKLQN